MSRTITAYQRSLLSLTLSVLVGFVGATLLPVQAAVTPSPSPTLPVATVTDIPASQAGTVNENLKKVIDKVVEENQAAVNAKVAAIKNRRKGIVGEVKSIREGIITLNTHRGTQVIPTDKAVQLIKSGKTILIDAVAVGDWVTVMGSFENDDFKAEKIIISAKPLMTIKPLVVLGTIQDISSSELQLKDRVNQEEKNWTLSKTTLWQDVTGTKTAVTNFSENMQVLTLGLETEGSTKVYSVRALAPFAKITPNTKTR
jgi:putative component of toxin-antitoxin plasmid stabilization module